MASPRLFYRWPLWDRFWRLVRHRTFRSGRGRQKTIEADGTPCFAGGNDAAAQMGESDTETSSQFGRPDEWADMLPFRCGSAAGAHSPGQRTVEKETKDETLIKNRAQNDLGCGDAGGRGCRGDVPRFRAGRGPGLLWLWRATSAGAGLRSLQPLLHAGLLRARLQLRLWLCPRLLLWPGYQPGLRLW